MAAGTESSRNPVYRGPSTGGHSSVLGVDFFLSEHGMGSSDDTAGSDLPLPVVDRTRMFLLHTCGYLCSFCDGEAGIAVSVSFRAMILVDSGSDKTCCNAISATGALIRDRMVPLR